MEERPLCVPCGSPGFRGHQAMSYMSYGMQFFLDICGLRENSFFFSDMFRASIERAFWKKQSLAKYI